jgi:hypothetical protein
MLFEGFIIDVFLHYAFSHFFVVQKYLIVRLIFVENKFTGGFGVLK